MMRLRTYRLEYARETVLRLAKFRKPQRASFDATHKLISELDDDLPRLDRTRLLHQLRESGLNVPALPPDLVFELATGVGKTRLMGGLIAYLFLAGQSRNAVILASRTAIVDKLERESQSGSSKYLLVDPALVPEPNLCFRSALGSFVPDSERLSLFVLSPQIITGSDRRFARRSDFGRSMLEYLRDVPDLVVYVDESHHLQGRGNDETTAWREAVAQLEPQLQFGFTATPLPDKGANILHSYGLAECLRDGQYTKAVKLWVEEAPDNVSEAEWDWVTLDFAIQRLEKKRLALRGYANEHPEFAFVEPVMLVAARDTEHAEDVAKWLIDRRNFAKEEVHVSHSQRRNTEDEVRKLVAIDQPGNRIRVVVNVFQLSEGWDVTNVYVVVPLRAMATYQNAVQSMGRGLRLPAGRRVEEPEVDTLDVLCFGRQSFEAIVEQATHQFGRGPDGSAAVVLAVPKDDTATIAPTKRITINPRIQVEFEVPSVRRIPPDPVLDFEIAKAPAVQVVSGIDIVSLDRVAADDEQLRYNAATIVKNATLRVLADLPYLSPALHHAPVEALVQALLKRLGAKDNDNIALDPLKVAMLVSDEIDRRYKSQPVRFELFGSPHKIMPEAFEWHVPEDLEEPILDSSIAEWQ